MTRCQRFIDSLQAERCHCLTFCRGLSNIWERRRPDWKLAPSDRDIRSYGSNSEAMSFDRCGGRKVSILVFGPSHTISQLNFSLHKGWVGGPHAFCNSTTSVYGPPSPPLLLWPIFLYVIFLKGKCLLCSISRNIDIN